jgi:hypothetical protein
LLQTQGLAGYEPATTAVFIEALWHGPEGAVVDVGANFGLYALVASALIDRGVGCGTGLEPSQVGGDG